jgi:hypothetical protein
MRLARADDRMSAGNFSGNCASNSGVRDQLMR